MIVKFFKLIYLTIVFHHPVFRKGLLIHDLPKWAVYAIEIRNKFESNRTTWYWFRLGRFYVRGIYNFPQSDIFTYSKNPLFVWRNDDL